MNSVTKKDFQRLRTGIELMKESIADYSDRELSDQEKGNLVLELRNLGNELHRVAKNLGIDSDGSFDPSKTVVEDISIFNEINNDIRIIKSEIISMIS